ncbi:MAG: SpoIIE family protein phosphatase [Victivallaceae bacterium]
MTAAAPPAYETFVEIECRQAVKDGQSVCGDDFKSLRIEQEKRHIAVLSDGLGSGIKANLLAGMTTTMALEFVRRNMEIVRSAEIIMDTLPVCEVRKISYATFTVFDLLPGGRTRVIEMDNPPFIHLRGDKALDWPRRMLASERWPERQLALSEFRVMPGDRLIAFSDGVSQAGIGGGEHRFGWKREGALDFIRAQIGAEPELSARDLSERVVNRARMFNPGCRCIDDISCLVIYLRRPRRLRLLTGPPFNGRDDHDYAATLLNFDGRSAVCGGTTAALVARELGRKLETDIREVLASPGHPPAAKIAGIDLVTEGILTLTECARHLESGDFSGAAPAVRKLLDLLTGSDIIEFMVGTRVNEAHQDPKLPIDLEIRRNIIKKMRELLEKQYRKESVIQYF